MKKVFIIDNKFNCLSCANCSEEIRLANAKDYYYGCSIHYNCTSYCCRPCQEGKQTKDPRDTTREDKTDD